MYIPSQILQGKELYRDITIEYAALGYYFNALVLKFFGISAETFKLCGLFSSFIIYTFLYLIFKMYTNRTVTVLSLLSLIFTCTYFPSVSNWITPYSYSIVYALVSVCAAVYFLIMYDKTDKRKFLYLSSLFYGLSVTFKYDYFAFALPLIYMLVKKRVTITGILKTITAGLSFPVLTLVFLFLRGVTPDIIISAVKYILLFSKATSVKFMYNHVGILLSFKTIQYIRESFYPAPSLVSFYAWGYFNVIILFILLFMKEKRKQLILPVLISVFISIKVISGVNNEIYGTYFLPFLFFGVIIFLYNISNKTKFLAGLISIAALLSFALFDFNREKLITVKAPLGNIKISQIYAEETKELINFIANDTKKDDKILILPEGVTINFLTERTSDNRLFNGIPPVFEVFPEDYVVSEIINNDVKYIITQNIMYLWYNEKSFSSSFGKNILNKLKKDYKLKKIIGENFQLCIYEKID